MNKDMKPVEASATRRRHAKLSALAALVAVVITPDVAAAEGGSVSGPIESSVAFVGRSDNGEKVTLGINVTNISDKLISLAAIPNWPRVIDNKGNTYLRDRFAGLSSCIDRLGLPRSSVDNCSKNELNRLPYNSYSPLNPGDTIFLTLTTVIDGTPNSLGTQGVVAMSLGSFDGDPGSYKEFDPANYRVLNVSISGFAFE